MIELSKDQIEMMKHCIAYDKPDYKRNWYDVGPGCDGFKEWQELKAAGYATCRKAPFGSKSVVFRLTSFGFRKLFEAING